MEGGKARGGGGQEAETGGDMEVEAVVVPLMADKVMGMVIMAEEAGSDADKNCFGCKGWVLRVGGGGRD